jgi:alkanesulfonate monooxygenase SsuD/methylene tetrahydromethanopterin reductase-like flavin-dependent oxidoreductase (luciferase family)
MAGRERLLDPTGDSDRTADATLSPRLRSVRGLTVGLLANTKPNAAVLLSNVARELQRTHGLRAAVMYTKSYFGTPTEESLIQQMRMRVLFEPHYGTSYDQILALVRATEEAGFDVTGTPGDVAARLAELQAAGADTFYFHLYDVADLDHVRLLGREVLPRLE